MTDATYYDETGDGVVTPDNLANGESVTPELAHLLEVDTTPLNPSVWADLSLQVPNDLPSTRVASFVECVLVELRHEPIAAVYRSNEEWGTIDTITVHSEWMTVPTDDPFCVAVAIPGLGCRYHRVHDEPFGTHSWIDLPATAPSVLQSSWTVSPSIRCRRSVVWSSEEPLSVTWIRIFR